MLKIGEFSRLSQISIKALRIYDERGLLRPDHVDQFTGYRYYTLRQLPRAHRIMALKEMGLSLEQVSIMVNQDMSVDELRGMLRLKHAEIEQRVRDEQKRLAIVEFHLHMIELEGNMPDLNIIVKEIPAFDAMYLRFQPTEGEIPQVGQEIDKLRDSGAIKHTGQYIGGMFGEKINHPDYDFCFIIPITDDHTEDEIDLPTGHTLIRKTMPKSLAATVVVNGHGEFELLEDQVMVERWAVENGYTLRKEIRAIHHKGYMHGVPESEFVTELQILVEPRD